MLWNLLKLLADLAGVTERHCIAKHLGYRSRIVGRDGLYRTYCSKCGTTYQ